MVSGELSRHKAAAIGELEHSCIWHAMQESIT